jgi:hypothetical protein
MAYGGGLLSYFYPDGSLPYDVLVGLELNAERVLLRPAVNTALGVGVAQSRGAVERAYYDALCADESEVDEVMARSNAKRELAAMRGMR